MGFYHLRYPALIIVLILSSFLLLFWQESLNISQRIGFQDRFRFQHNFASSPYHERLDHIRPIDNAPHSKTLGVPGRIYVVSLAKRMDRRTMMQKIADALDVELTWHDATDMHGQDVKDIMERLRWWRNENRANDSLPKEDPSPFKFAWAEDIDSTSSVVGLSGADYWLSSVPNSPLSPIPAPPSPDKRPTLLSAKLDNGDKFGEKLYPAQVSCWHSHYSLLRRIAEGDDEVALILEDDVDIEWNIERRLLQMWPALPSDWDMVMLGHCHSQEWTKPPLQGAPTLHPSFTTLCTHAYVVNRNSARRLVRRLRTEAFAYSRPIDHAYYYLFSHKGIKSFSVYPPIIVQTYQMGSDIVPNRPSTDREQWLEDSTLERIQLAKAIESGSILGA